MGLVWNSTPKKMKTLGTQMIPSHLLKEILTKNVLNLTKIR